MKLHLSLWRPNLVTLSHDIGTYSKLLSPRFIPDERCRERLLLNEFESIAMGCGIIINPGKVDFNKFGSTSLALNKDRSSLITYEDLSKLITGSDDPMRSLLSKRTEHLEKYGKTISGLVYYLVTLERCYDRAADRMYVISEYDKFVPEILTSLEDGTLAEDLIIDTLYDIRSNTVSKKPENHFIMTAFYDEYCYKFKHPKDTLVLLITKYLDLLIKTKRYSDIDNLIEQIAPLTCYEGLAEPLVKYYRRIKEIDLGLFFFEFEQDYCMSFKMKTKNLALARKELEEIAVR